MKRWEDHKAGQGEKFISSPHAGTEDSRGDSNDSNESKLSKQMVSYYRNETQGSAGTGDENWTQIISDYEDLTERLGLKRKQKMQFVSVIFKDDAKRFYHNEAKHLKTWGEAMVVLNEKCNYEVSFRRLIE